MAAGASTGDYPDAHKVAISAVRRNARAVAGSSAAQHTATPHGLPAAALVICARRREPQPHEVCPHGHSSRAHGVGVAPRLHAVASGRRADRAGADHGRAPCRPSRAGARGAAARDARHRLDLRQPRAICAERGFCELSANLRTPILPRSRDMAVDLVWAPPVEAMYPPALPPASCRRDRQRPGSRTSFARISLPASRPWSAKLLIQCAPDFAMFGEKDYQQLKVVTRLAKDLDLPVKIVAVADRARAGRPRSVLAQQLSVGERARGRTHASPRAQGLRGQDCARRTRSPACSTRAPPPSSAPASCSTISRPATPIRSRRVTSLERRADPAARRRAHRQDAADRQYLGVSNRGASCDSAPRYRVRVRRAISSPSAGP